MAEAANKKKVPLELLTSDTIADFLASFFVPVL